MLVLKQIKAVAKILNAQERWWIIFTVACLAALGVFAFILPPLGLYFVTSRRQFEMEGKNRKLESAKIEELMGKKYQIEKAGQAASQARERFFDDTGESLFLKQLGRLAKDLKGQITFLKPLSEENIDEVSINATERYAYVRSLVDVQWSGKFASLLDFLQMLKTYKNIVSVEDIRVNVNARGADNHLDVQMTLGLYKATEKK